MLASVIVFAAMLLNTLHCSSLLAGRRTSIFHSRLALQAGPERVADAPGGRSRGVDGHGNGNGSSDRGFQSGESQRGAPRERKFEPRDKRTNSADLAAVGTAAATAKDLDVWRTGDIFTKTPREREARGRGRQDPWWMRDDEKDNPKMLPAYKPWWVESNVIVNDSWKVADLKKEAERRGLNTVGKLKADLVEALVLSSRRYDISESGYTAPVFTANEAKKELPPCYPEVYEGKDNYENIRNTLAQNKML